MIVSLGRSNREAIDRGLSTARATVRSNFEGLTLSVEHAEIDKGRGIASGHLRRTVTATR